VSHPLLPQFSHKVQLHIDPAASCLALCFTSAKLLQQKQTLSRLPHYTTENQQSKKTINQTRALLQHQHKNEPVAITTEKQNSSSLKHTTSTLEDGQLGQTMCVRVTIQRSGKVNINQSCTQGTRQKWNKMSDHYMFACKGPAQSLVDTDRYLLMEDNK
jgi:hypothetical protein